MKKYSITLIVLFLFHLVAGAHPFPVCMYGVDDIAYLSVLKKAGFTCVQSYMSANPEKMARLAQAAKKHNLQIVLYPNHLYNTPYEQQAAGWPILAWYIVDEPDVNRWSRETTQKATQKAKQTWPMHQTALVIGQGKTRIAFYDIPDVMMMDWYPVPHLPLISFGDNVRWTAQGQQAYGKTGAQLWGVVQSFDWREFKQYRADQDRIGRFPTEDEIRFMSYDGIVNGATGLFYFIFTTKGKPLPAEQPEWWSRVANVTRELAKMRPVLEQGEFTDNPVEIAAPLVMQTRRYKRRLYSILINRSDSPQSVPALLLDKRYKAQFKRKKTATIPPYTVWVLKK